MNNSKSVPIELLKQIAPDEPETEPEDLPRNYDDEHFDAERQMYEAEQAEIEKAEAARIEELTSNTVSIGKLLKIPRNPVRAYVPQLVVPGALTMLSGRPKAGKSTLLWWALGAVTRREPFLGEETHFEKVVYASEQSTPILLEQLSTFPIPAFANNDDIHVIPLENNGQLQKVIADELGREVVIREPWANWRAQVCYWCEVLRNTRAKILVVDTFSAFALLESGEGNDAGIITQRLTELKQAVYGLNRDIAIVILHHLRKGKKNSNPTFEDVAGSFGMRGAPDINALLYKPVSEPDNSPVRVLQTEGRLGHSDRTIRLKSDGYHLYDLAAAVAFPKEFGEQEALFKAHVLNPQLETRSLRDVAKETGISKYHVEKFRKIYPSDRRYFRDAQVEGRLSELRPLGQLSPKAG